MCGALLTACVLFPRRVDQRETEESIRGSGEAAALPGVFTVHLHQDGVHRGFTQRRARTWKESREPDGSSPGEGSREQESH